MAIDINIPSQVKTFANLAGFPVTGAVKTIYIAEDTNKTYRWTGSVYVEISASAAGSTWGSITGTLSSQTDLQNALNTKEPTITAGTTAQYYRGDKSFQTLDKNAVGLSNVDNTSDADKPISTATQSALNAKQNNLISGFNIKTVNSQSILGIGQVTVQDTLVSGTNIKTINGSSVLGSGDLVVSGGGASGIHAITALTSGQSTYAGTTSQGFSSSSSVFNRLIACPFIPNQNITSSSLYMNVAGATPSAQARILIYSNLNGLPDQKLYESTNLDCSTIGIKTATTTFNFVAGTTYWLCLHNTPTFNVSLINSSGSIPLNVVAVTNPMTHLYMNVTFGSAPTTFGTPIYASGNPPFIGITKA